MARIAAPQRRSNLALWALVLLGVGLLSLLPLALGGSSGDDAATVGAATSSGPRVAYFSFDRNADTLWLADPSAPSARVKGLAIQHAPEYGVIPTLSPDRGSIAYLVLPPDTPAPGPDAPAELWVASIDGSQPRLVATDADLLVPAVWGSDGQTLVFRRSDHLSRLIVVRLDGATSELRTSSNALFPVAFAGDDLYYVELSATGSQLSSTQGDVTYWLSDGLTRDWTLSPDGGRLAYLEMTLSGQRASSRAYVIEVATGKRIAVGDPDSDAFSPVWRPNGSLVLGMLAPGASSTAAVVLGEGFSLSLAAPRQGFDVPLAVDANAGTAVTSFDGNSIINPGRASLVVVNTDGSRREIASGEVTFVGWINP